MRTTTIILAVCLLAACATDRGANEGRGRNVAAAADRPTAGIVVGAMIVELSEASLAELLGDDDHGRVRAVGFDVAVRELAQRNAEVSIEARPRLTLADGAAGEISSVRREEFFGDYKISPEGRATRISYTLEEGVWLETRPEIGAGSSIRLELKLKHARVLRPIGEMTVEPKGSRQEVTVQLPGVVVHEFDEVTVLRPGESWFASLEPPDPTRPGRRTIAIVTPAITDLPQETGFRVSTESAVHEAAATR